MDIISIFLKCCYLANLWVVTSIFKVITKSKVDSLTMQPAKHDVTGVPLYRMYPYPIRSSTLWIPLFCLIYQKLFWKVWKILLDREILPKVLRNNLKIFKRKIGKFRELLPRISRNISWNFENYTEKYRKSFPKISEDFVKYFGNFREVFQKIL